MSFFELYVGLIELLTMPSLEHDLATQILSHRQIDSICLKIDFLRGDLYFKSMIKRFLPKTSYIENRPKYGTSSSESFTDKLQKNCFFFFVAEQLPRVFHRKAAVAEYIRRWAAAAQNLIQTSSREYFRAATEYSVD